MSNFITYLEEDQAYALTGAGVAAIIALIVILLIIIAFLGSGKKRAEEREAKAKKQSAFSAKRLSFSAVSIALAFVLSYVKVVDLPWGGSATLCSMLFIVLIGYWYGPKVGLIAGFVYGCLQFIQGGGSYILSPLQACLDYILAFTALGLSGFFSKDKKNGLLIGYIVAVVARGALHSLGGYLYWMDYMPEEFPASLAAVYPIVYNYAYILIEAVITIIIISLPPVKKALNKVGEMAIQ